VEALYRSILASGLPDPIRVSALSGLAATAGAGSLPEIQSAFHDSHPRVRTAAANLFAVVAGTDAITECALHFQDHDPVVQMVILDAFDSRRATDGMPLFKAAMAAADPEVRVAALRGLGDTGLPEATALLINRLAGLSAESTAAADSLGRLRAPGVVTALLASARAASPAQKALILQILGSRADHRVYPLAMAAAGDPNASVRTAAFAAIAAT
jgi:HEAT repeat protein